ncbi:MAG: hypothetical protein A2527_03335 [Candidatus Lambdaproteobacteria bacterium RIFOXYD2_FULL_50_16]|uniref:Hydrolase TatD n=1 Tax=Candidatus Lambdaproteobacteria bacterium RIFOXYD2_FULL_50_16 TaxID=1817772 RepID=A0A1F6GET7_9PROT|nr:MAG: hypothetical protein A2527_03335 [Candidatus Lambdaproteobacteria bacterium RIFOXYD2_FULL_50_16]
MTQTPRWIDTHCHLEMLKEDPRLGLEKGQNEGLALALTIGTDAASNRLVTQFTEEFEMVYGALGTHPHQAKDWDQAELGWMEEAFNQNSKLVALGECGLDYHYEFSPKKAQRQAFLDQMGLAIKLNLPLVIHSREAEADTLACLAEVDSQRLRGVFHSFTGSLQMAEQILAMGFYIGFNGIATFPKSDQVREVLDIVPLERLLLETDAPYLSPVPHRGRPNLPGHVAQVGRYIAKHLGLAELELSEICYQNSLNLFDRIETQMGAHAG